jgi:hypothetical protein
VHDMRQAFSLHSRRIRHSRAQTTR